MQKRILVTSIIIVLILSLVACSNQELITPDGEDYSKYKLKSYESLEFFGTSTYMVLGANFKKSEICQKAEILWTNVKNELRVLDNKINENINGSDIYNFNNAKAGEKLEISNYTYDLLNKCKEYYIVTNGMFNPAVANLVDLWGFTPRFESINYKPIKPYDREDYRNNLPSIEYINAFSKLTNFNDIKLSKEENKYYVIKPENTQNVGDVEYSMKLSLGGVGKGYACDIANDLIKKEFNFGYISIGGSSMAINKSIKPITNNPLDWKVGIRHPRKENELYMNLYFSDASLSTSGDYERYYELNGKRYSHIISNNGYPTDTRIITASIIGKSAAMCDALTTAICNMTLENAIQFLNCNFVKENQLEIYYVYNGLNKEVYTNSSLELLDDTFKVI